MNRNPPDISDWDITTEAEFDSAPQTLLLAALTADTDSLGAWEFRHGEKLPDLEVVVSELAKQSSGS
jgi:hypothetical protein